MNTLEKVRLVVSGVLIGGLLSFVAVTPLDLFIFLFGLAVGSFLNVVAFRYEETHGFFHVPSLRGRSRCLVCLKSLRWYELIPVVSFFLQNARCRQCLVKLSWQYPLVEFLTGLAAVLIYRSFSGFDLVLWLIAAAVLIVLAAIDVRTRLIPDETNLIIFILGLVRLFSGYNAPHHSFLKFFDHFFGITSPLWLNQLVGLAVGGAIFAIIILATRGRAMGVGDLKLGAAAGFFLGWPDILIALMIAFIAGGVVSIGLILRKRKGLKDVLPFGPFIVFGIIIVALWGEALMSGYINFFSFLESLLL